MLGARILFLIFISYQVSAFSQQAVDFILTDLDGKKWHLFEELDNGKTVLLDFFYADCVPCQTLTPQIVQIYDDYGSDTGQVLVLGISDRDNNIKLRTFESDYNVNYPSGGTEGNGDSITLAYSSWFSFIGWPTYAVVCPNRNMSWDLDKSQSGLPEIRSAIDTCVFYMSVEDKTISNAFTLNVKDDRIEVINKSNGPLSLQIFDINGRLLLKSEILNNSNPSVYFLSDLNMGLYIIRLHSNTTVQTYKYIKRQ